MFLLVVAWLGGGNYIIIESFRRKNIQWLNIFNPFAIFNLEKKDYLKLFILAVLVLTIMVFTLSLSK